MNREEFEPTTSITARPFCKLNQGFLIYKSIYMPRKYLWTSMSMKMEAYETLCISVRVFWALV